MKVLMDLQVQRQPQERITVRRNLVDQAQRFRVGADENVQTIVECGVVDGDTPRASAQQGRDLEYGDRHITRREFHRRGHAGVAAAEDGG